MDRAERLRIEADASGMISGGGRDDPVTDARAALALRDWTPEEKALWDRIEAHDFEAADQALNFTGRLARDHGWTLDFARRAIGEYRRFAFLAALSRQPVTPSEEVDEVWHQHLTYSRDYWERWCGEVLRRPLHHGPTKGGAEEGSRFARQYAETLALLEQYFGPIDPEFWPGTARRFAVRPRFRVIDRDEVVLVPRPSALLRRLRHRLQGSGRRPPLFSRKDDRP